MLRSEFTREFKNLLDEFVMEKLWGGEDYQIDMIQEGHPLHDDELDSPVVLYIYSCDKQELEDFVELEEGEDELEDFDTLCVVQYAGCCFEEIKTLGVFKTLEEADKYAKDYQQAALNDVAFIQKVEIEYERRQGEKFENQIKLKRQRGDFD